VEGSICKPISLAGLPMPPSANKLYFAYKGRMIPSKELTNYKKAAIRYGLSHALQIQEAKRSCLRATENGYALHFDRIYYMSRKRIFTKKGTPRKMDQTNRIKAFDDALSGLIAIDDSWIFSSTSRKQVSADSLSEYVDLTISFVKLSDFDIVA
jgi:hypothetical protein